MVLGRLLEVSSLLEIYVYKHKNRIQPHKNQVVFIGQVVIVKIDVLESMRT